MRHPSCLVASILILLTSFCLTPQSHANYDAKYRLTSVEDGNSNVTHYQYSPQGYLCNIAYPGATLSNTDTSGLWQGYDTIRYTNFDYDGNPEYRTDGRAYGSSYAGVTTQYAYDD